MNNSRKIVVEALRRMDVNDAWSNRVWDTAVNRSQLSPQDTSFATVLFYGTVARRITLDACLAPLSARPIAKLDPTVHEILRTAIYQLLYMDSIPHHAAVDEAVNLTRTLRVASAAGFVNGVLRAFLRSDKKVPLAGLSTEQRLSVEYSCPFDLVQFFIASYGEEQATAVLQASLEAPATFLRVNILRTTAEALQALLAAEDITTTIHPSLANCLRVESGRGVHRSPLLADGFFHVQDYSSQYAAHAVGAVPQDSVLDTCAAPGGKTFILAQSMANQGRLVATDLHPHRIEQVAQRAQALGITNLQTHCLDMKDYHPELGTFDRVLCDVPCSGLGVLRRRPEIKYKALQGFEGLPAVQYQLLTAGAKHCKKGGILVYSTCTLSPRENQDLVAKFLADHPAFVLTNGETGQTLFPSAHGADGFYVAVLQHRL